MFCFLPFLEEECALTDVCDYAGNDDQGYYLPASSDDEASDSGSRDSGDSRDDDGEDCPVELADCLVCRCRGGGTGERALAMVRVERQLLRTTRDRNFTFLAPLEAQKKAVLSIDRR